MTDAEAPRPSFTLKDLERIDVETQKQARELLNGVSLLVDSVATDTGTLANGDLALLDTAAMIEQCAAEIFAFMETPMVLISGRPREPRKKDRIRFLPGEHKGISLQFVGNTGETIRLNVYGGLRDLRAPEDMRDSDIACVRIIQGEP